MSIRYIRVFKIIETESRIMVIRDWGKEGKGSCYLMGTVSDLPDEKVLDMYFTIV